MQLKEIRLHGKRFVEVWRSLKVNADKSKVMMLGEEKGIRMDRARSGIDVAGWLA